MPESIPDGITRDDVIDGIRAFEAGAEHDFFDSIEYDLLYEGKRYPPKAILGLAARRTAGRVLKPSDFSGGELSKCFRILRGLGFEIEHKPGTDDGRDDSPTVMLTTEETPAATYIEGAVKSVLVNVYERDRKARAACIAHHGLSCVVCGFDFSKVYGEIGRGFIHVHHLKDLAEIGVEYKVDPIADLRPVCPNCHAMLHVTRPAMMIEHLRTKMQQRND